MKKESKRQLFVTFIPSIVVLIIMVIVSLIFNISCDKMTRDPLAIACISPLSGILSNLGVLLWCSTASICFFSALLLLHFKPRGSFWFLLSSALLSAYLLFDDLFQIHDNLVGDLLGLSEYVVFAAIGVAISAYLFVFRRVIMRTNYGFLLLALGFLAASVAIDAIFYQWFLPLGHWKYLLEDGSKWLGISCWCSYYVYTSHQLLLGIFGNPPTSSTLSETVSNVEDSCRRP
jgi:hypothetical protein